MTNEAIAAAGQKIYEGIRAEMEANHWGRLVVIDIFSGDYEVGDDDRTATNRLFERQPDALTWAARPGYPAPYYKHIGRKPPAHMAYRVAAM